MTQHYLPNKAFLNFSCDCCSGNTWVDRTPFGQWVDSGFKSKKKRDAEAAANLAASSKQIQQMYGTSNQACTVTPDAANSAGGNYCGIGISKNIICKISPTTSFGSIPIIGSLVDSSSGNSDSTNNPNSTVMSKSGDLVPHKTNYLAWGVVGAVFIGAGTLFYFKVIKKK